MAAEEWIAPWSESRWLTLSSFFFTAPAAYSYWNGLYTDSTLLLATSAISANFWRRATKGWRRDLDLAYSKFIFIVWVSKGVYYVTYWPYLVSGYSGLIALSYCFYQSAKRHREGVRDWYWYHFLFHLIMMYEQFIILRSSLLE